MADANWVDRLQRAKWRDFEFLTDSHDSQHGRRLVVTELPGADEPILEDLGAKADGWKVAAYFLGPQYDRERNKFLMLLGTPGPAWLTHPWLGLVWARAQSWTVRESTDKGGFCTVQVDFVPGGQSPEVPQVDMVDTAFGRIRELAGATEFEPEVMPENTLESFIASVQGRLDGVRTAMSLARLPLTWVRQILATVDSAKALLGEALALPGEYMALMHGVGTALSSPPADELGDAARLRAVAALARTAVRSASAPMTGVTAAAQRRNLQADALHRTVVLTAAAMQVALADYRTAMARDEAVAAVLRALDVAMPLLNDRAFEVAANARGALLQALNAQVLGTQQVRDVVHATPSVVLVYELAVDEPAFLERNAVRHPLFVQGRVYG